MGRGRGSASVVLTHETGCAETKWELPLLATARERLEILAPLGARGVWGGVYSGFGRESKSTICYLGEGFRSKQSREMGVVNGEQQDQKPTKGT